MSLFLDSFNRKHLLNSCSHIKLFISNYFIFQLIASDAHPVYLFTFVNSCFRQQRFNYWVHWT